MTQTSDFAPTRGTNTRDSQPVASHLGPPTQVRLLLPVWGEQFIVQFLRISLPTLLAPGNLPAVAAALPCTLIFLTDSEGAKLLLDNPSTIYLRNICNVEFSIIDDLITGDNYSTTLTLAYARAVRASGKNMVDTCFFFLISDYIMADGSLANVLARVQSGASGVLAGNFQVVEEDAKYTFFERFDTGKPNIDVNARELIEWAVDYLHPMTLANTVNFPMYFSSYSNRLFWRVDPNTMIGRFYLMHMIAIRPEVTDFHIGASCDYSFIPEMCPSGNVHTVTDSDEYLVVEMQRRSHEKQFIQLGSVDRTELTKSLATWTTKQHRANAHSAMVFHAGELPSDLDRFVSESSEFVASIEADLSPSQPFRDHPYWLGAIAAHRRAVRKKQTTDDPLIGADELARGVSYHDLLFKLRNIFVGRPALGRRLHPRWPDYRMIQDMESHYFTGKKRRRSLILSSGAATFEGWLDVSGRKKDSVSFHQFLQHDADRCEELAGEYEGCVLVLVESELGYLSSLLPRILPLFSVGDHILIFILNGRGLMLGRHFNQDVLREAPGLFDRRLVFDEVKFVVAGWSTWLALCGIRALFGSAMRNPFYFVLAAVPMAFLILMTVARNVFGRDAVRHPPNGQLCSSIGIAMRILSQASAWSSTPNVSELDLAGRRFGSIDVPATASSGAESEHLSQTDK